MLSNLIYRGWSKVNKRFEKYKACLVEKMLSLVKMWIF